MYETPFLDLKAVNQQYINEIQDAVHGVLNSGWYLRGEATARFEQAYARYIGSDHCVGVGNGLDALMLIYRAYMELGFLQEGDEVLVPAHTFIASVLAISENGLKPVFVDVDRHTLTVHVDTLRQQLTPRTRSLMLVHLYGRCAWTTEVAHFAQEHHLLLIEDNAQAHGCRCPDGRRTGSIGHAAGHSFYPGKNLGAMGDAGCVTTNDGRLAATVRALANYGSEQKYHHRLLGRNSRMDELQAAVLGVRLRHLDHDNAVRQRVADHYYHHMENPLVELPPQLPSGQNVYHLFPVFCAERNRLQQHLSEHGIETLIHYPTPPHRQPCYAHLSHQQLPGADLVSQQELSLPMSPVMTMAEAQRVAEAVNGFRQ